MRVNYASNSLDVKKRGVNFKITWNIKDLSLSF